MSSTHPVTPDSDPDLSALLARAERRRAGLERLGEAALAVSIEIATRMVDSPYHPEPRHEPGRAFASASRAVRLTFAMEARIDERIFAVRKGGAGVILARAMAEAARPAVAASGITPVVRERVESDDGRPREDLVDRERVDPPGGGRLERVREMVCADLGFGAESPERSGLEISGEHRAFPPPRSRPEGESRPPTSGEGGGSGLASTPGPILPISNDRPRIGGRRAGRLVDARRRSR